MQSLLLLSLINPAPPPKRSGQPQIFAQISAERAVRWPSFLVSAVLHTVLLLVVPSVTAHLGTTVDRETTMRQERLLRTLRIHVPERLYIASASPAAAQSKSMAVYRPVVLARSGPAAQTPQGARASRVPGRQRRFDLPPLPRRTNSDQSIVQPRYPSETLPVRDLRLPEMFFWSPSLAPQTVATPVVTPGHTVAPTQPRMLDAPPRLDMPSPDPVGFTLHSMLQPWARGFTLPSQSGMPIRTTYPDEPAPRNGSSADPIPGDPTTVLSISTSPSPLREFLTVPPGNQVGLSPAAGREAQTWAGSGRGARGTGGNGSSESGGSQNAAGDRSGNGGAGASGAQGARGDARGGAPDAAAERSAAANGSSGQASGSTVRTAEVEATRIVHPSNGVFDVVVQSSGLDGFPESSGVLSGKPIYSVYLAVGAPKEWILQYCVPAGEADSVQVVGGVVKLGVNAPLVAPYPQTTFRPPPHNRPGGYMMVHGFIGVHGRFQDLKVLGSGDSMENADAISILGQWEFRPATRQGQPMHVEILLAIPAE